MIPQNEEITILVRATCPVIGLHTNQEADVYPSRRIELLIAKGHLVWVDEPVEEEDNGALDDGPDPDHGV